MVYSLRKNLLLNQRGKFVLLQQNFFGREGAGGKGDYVRVVSAESIILSLECFMAVLKLDCQLNKI